MIRSFKSKDAEEIYQRFHKRRSASLERASFRKLRALNTASSSATNGVFVE